jgi:hypothetical protein
MRLFASHEASEIGVTMTAAALAEKIEAAKQRLTAAEGELASDLQKLTAATGGETTFVAKLLDAGFRKLREAQRHLAELEGMPYACDVAR